jgi:hypothetical protein
MYTRMPQHPQFMPKICLHVYTAHLPRAATATFTGDAAMHSTDSAIASGRSQNLL